MLLFGCREKTCNMLKMEYMPEDLLNEIMLKLPMKSVCKSWYSFLNSSDFIIRYLQLSNNNKIKQMNNNDHDLVIRYRIHYHPHLISILSHETLGIVSTHRLSITYSQSTVGVETGYAYIAGCCNGIVFIADYFSDVHMLWNPKTKQVKELPRTLYIQHPGCAQLVGFGYDDKNNDCKVVSLRQYESCFDHVEVYSLKLDCWRKVTSNVKESDLCVTSSIGTRTDGMCSWLVLNGRGHEAALSFEMSKETMILTPFPSLKNRHTCGGVTIREKYTTKLVDLNGHVAFFAYVKGIICNIWWLGEIGMEDSWTKLFSIQLQCNERPLGFWNNFGLLLHKDNDGGELVLLDIATHQRKSLQTGIIPSGKIFNFTESMAPIN